MFVVHLHSGKKTVIKIKIYPYEIACIIWINIGNTASYLSFVPSTKNDMTKCLLSTQPAVYIAERGPEATKTNSRKNTRM